jgi:phosphotransferase system  glucose/maltose/N-acetylglucosamine-specific IIC component
LTKIEFQSSKTQTRKKSSEEFWPPIPRIPSSSIFADLNQLDATGAAGFNLNIGFGAFEVFCDERDQFFVCLAIDRRRLQVGEPRSILPLLKEARP